MKAFQDLDVPWEKAQLCKLPESILPPLTIVQEGWKEREHYTLQSLKEKISSCASPEAWEIRKKVTNPYEPIFTAKEDDSFPSLVSVQPLSRSYFKMIEICQTFQLLESIPSSYTSAHICEGPGGFIQALTYLLHQKGHAPASRITAMTLKPVKNHIPGWRRSVQFLRRHKEIHLHYGEDSTGNILIPANQDSFVRQAAGSNFFTADGGFDFSVDYNTQELQAFELLIASFLIGLRTLAIGGNMCIKLFDMYSAATQDVLLGSACFFKEFTIYKPATSRPCNSERYFIAKGYKGSGLASRWIAHLEKAAEAHNKSPITRLFAEPWPEEVQAAVKEQMEWQENLQMKRIEQALFLQNSEIESYLAKGLQMSKAWCTHFQVPS